MFNLNTLSIKVQNGEQINFCEHFIKLSSNIFNISFASIYIINKNTRKDK